MRLFSTLTAVCVKCVVPDQWVHGTAICDCVLLSQQCVLNELCVSKLEIAWNQQRQLVIMREDLKAHSLVAAPRPYKFLH